MSTTHKIERAIEQLPPAEFAALRDWLLALDARRWDEQLERDVGAVEGVAEEDLRGISQQCWWGSAEFLSPLQGYNNFAGVVFK
jgi:hypothetical protein